MPSSQSSAAPRGTLLGGSPWTISRRVVGALVLRELLTRYGRNNIGFLWLFVEPMLFTLVITAFWAATRTIHGSDIPIVAFALTGYSSVIMWRNMANRSIGALHSNKPLLYHRQVRVMDVYLSRLLLECMAASTSFVALGIAFYAMQWIPAPENALQVAGGWFLLAWFGAGLGLILGGLSEKSQVVAKLWPPFSYLLMPLSGVAFIVDALPPKLQEIVLWLPMLNALEFLREGWFGSLMHAHYDIPYVVVVNLALTFAGLSLARQVGVDTEEE
jgi:ABC-2 type transport system permease protein/capsular polysaccharide transport system permease protein